MQPPLQPPVSFVVAVLLIMIYGASCITAAAAAAALMPMHCMLCQYHLQAADYAEECAQIAGLSAAVLFPCNADAAAADTAAAGSSGSSAALAGEAAGSTPNPLFNTRALQLWILRGCQQLKGGLRDKPGKSADYYHTCYCLSGLSAAQHMSGGSVVGPVTPAAVSAAAAASGATAGGNGGSNDAHKGAVQHSNMLVAADPLLNIVVHKVAEAKEFFSQAGGVA